MQNQGINCYQLGIDDIKNLEVKKTYDIVMLLNVLEHLRNPALTLSLIREKVLNKKGVLVLEVPNDFNHLQQVANKEFKLDEWWVIPPNHINYFSPNSLISLLQACNYNILINTSFPLNVSLVGKIMLMIEILEQSVMKKFGLKN